MLRWWIGVLLMLNAALLAWNMDILMQWIWGTDTAPTPARMVQPSQPAASHAQEAASAASLPASATATPSSAPATPARALLKPASAAASSPTPAASY